MNINNGHIVGFKFSIMCNDRDVFPNGLSDQHSIERVLMVERQLR